MKPLLCVILLPALASCCRLSGPVDLGRGLHWANAPSFQPGELQTGTLSTGAKYASNDFCSGEHTGTHMDAPFHFYDRGWTIGEIPLSHLIGNGVFVNMSAEAAGDPDFVLQPEHLDTWIGLHGPLPDRAVVLFNFGWAQHHANRSLYFGSETNDTSLFRFPGLAGETAQALANSGRVLGVGVDTASVDSGGDRTYPAHTSLARENIYILENVDMDQPCLPDRGFTLYALPMKISNGTGAPVRIIAVPE